METMTEAHTTASPSNTNSELQDQHEDEFVDAEDLDMDDIIEAVESAVLDRIHDAMTAWSELHQPDGVEAGRQDYLTYFCGGDWKVYVEEDRYFDHGHTEYDFTVNVADAAVTSIEAISAPVIDQLERSANNMLALLNEVGEDIHEIDDLSLEAPIALTLRVLDASPIEEYEDGTWDLTLMPPDGVRLGVRARIEPSLHLEEALHAGQRLRDSKR